jgi:hypothetical protein
VSHSIPDVLLVSNGVSIEFAWWHGIYL